MTNKMTIYNNEIITYNFEDKISNLKQKLTFII